MAERIDVLLPVYVGADRCLLELAISSVFAQQYPAQALWVLINGGTAAERQNLIDGLAHLAPAGHVTRLQLLSLQEVGIAAALNQGLAHSDADWLARLDADDRMLPERLAVMVRHLERCRQAGSAVPDVLGSAVLLLDAAGQPLAGKRLRRPCRDRAIRRYLLVGNPFIHPSVMVRRALLAQVGGYRSSRGTEDLDLWLRLVGQPGISLANLPQALTMYAIRPGSLSHQADSFLQSALCRLRHCRSPWMALLHTPKILSDLMRYVLVRWWRLH
jgi:cellulose synthase/poly-beta-1,6-N-acetylglucosamine synthase-like glycosyltransferase